MCHGKKEEWLVGKRIELGEKTCERGRNMERENEIKELVGLEGKR